MRDSLKSAQMKRIEKQDLVKLHTYGVGDKVLFHKPGLSDKLDGAWLGPFEVTKRIGNVNYGVRDSTQGI